MFVQSPISNSYFFQTPNQGVPGAGVVDSSMMVTYEMIAKAKNTNRDTWSNVTYLRERAVSHIFARRPDSDMVNATDVSEAWKSWKSEGASASEE